MEEDASPAASAQELSHLFWVPARLHPQIAPEAFREWITTVASETGGNDAESLRRRRSKLVAATSTQAGGEIGTHMMAMIDVADDLGMHSSSDMNVVLKRRLSIDITPELLEKIQFNKKMSPIRPQGSTLKRSVRTRTVRVASEGSRPQRTLRATASMPVDVNVEDLALYDTSQANGSRSYSSSSTRDDSVEYSETGNRIRVMRTASVDQLVKRDTSVSKEDVKHEAVKSNGTFSRISSVARLFSNETSAGSLKSKKEYPKLGIDTNVASITEEEPKSKKFSMIGRIFSKQKSQITSPVEEITRPHSAVVGTRPAYEAIFDARPASTISPAFTRPVMPRRFPVHVERAIYKLSHTKLSNPRRPLREQVAISNLMFWYLSIVAPKMISERRPSPTSSPTKSESPTHSVSIPSASSISLPSPVSTQAPPRPGVPLRGIPGFERPQGRIRTPTPPILPDVLQQQRVNGGGGGLGLL